MAKHFHHRRRCIVSVCSRKNSIVDHQKLCVPVLCTGRRMRLVCNSTTTKAAAASALSSTSLVGLCFLRIELWLELRTYVTTQSHTHTFKFIVHWAHPVGIITQNDENTASKVKFFLLYDFPFESTYFDAHNAAWRTSTSHCRTAGNRRLSFMVFYDFVFRILCENDASASTYVSPSMLNEQTPHCERHHCTHRFQLGFDTGGVRFSLRQCFTQYIRCAWSFAEFYST